MGESGGSGAPRRYRRVIASLLITLALVGCGGLGLLPYQSESSSSGFSSLKALKTAYRAVKPGATLASDLGSLGFDPARTRNVQVLSYLGVIERFMPRDSLHFDKLAPAVQACIDARDRCTAYVFRSTSLQERASQSLLAGLIGSGAATAAGWSGEVVLLVQDGRVAYKAMSEAGGKRGGA